MVIGNTVAPPPSNALESSGSRDGKHRPDVTNVVMSSRAVPTARITISHLISLGFMGVRTRDSDRYFLEST